MQDQNTPNDVQAPPAKLPYERPQIIDYGSVRDLTRGAGSAATTDMMTGSRRKK